MAKQVFQVTTSKPQFAGQVEQTAAGGGSFYRQLCPTETDARAAIEGQSKARIWVYEPGVATGGEMLVSRGYA
jgi:hypothetical protein